MNRGRVWVRIARVDDIPLREGRSVAVGGREIAIFNLGSRFLSVANRCPHRDGPLADGMLSGASVVCPLHAWKFSLETGKGQAAPSLGSCVETFSTRVEAGSVLVELPLEPEDDERTARRLLAEGCLSRPRRIFGDALRSAGRQSDCVNREDPVPEDGFSADRESKPGAAGCRQETESTAGFLPASGAGNSAQNRFEK